jgi:hypothetical protein
MCVVMKKMDIKKDGVIGHIEYDFDGTKVQWSVHHPGGTIENELAEYFSTPREYRIPESQRIDDYRIDTALPTDDITYFKLSLCAMGANTSISMVTNGDRERLKTSE